MITEIKEQPTEESRKGVLENEIKRNIKLATESDVMHIRDAVNSGNIDYLIGYSTRGDVGKTAFILALGWQNMDISLQERFLSTALVARKKSLETILGIAGTDTLEEYEGICTSLNRLRGVFPIVTSEDGKMFPQRTDAAVSIPALRRSVGR